jgi:DNA-binding PadR family transcriptional regulator
MPGEPESTTSLIALGLLCDGPLHGYEMRQRFEQRGVPQFTRLTAGALHYALKGLEARGLISVVGSERVGARPERTTYRITDAGRASLHSGLLDTLGRLERVHPAIDAALSQASHLPTQDVMIALRERRERQAALVEALESQEPEIEAAIRAEQGSTARADDAELVLRLSMIRHARVHARAELEWLEATLAALARATGSKPRRRR